MKKEYKQKLNRSLKGLLTRTITGFFFVLLILVLISFAYAHGGRTNSEGCHNNRKTGDYHCHGSKKKSAPKKLTNSIYDRGDFGRWIDADGDCQDTRVEVLIEESLIPVTFKTEKECVVVAGKWIDPYTGLTFTDPSILDIDHVVPLKEAFLSGADEWPTEKKKQFANDLSNEHHLIAVSSSVNRSKSFRDPANWMPCNKKYHKEYVRIWMDIKGKWGLTMDDAEAKTIKKILENNLFNAGNSKGIYK